MTLGLPAITTGFSAGLWKQGARMESSPSVVILRQSSFTSDGSEYSSNDSSDMDDDMDDSKSSYGRGSSYQDDDDTPTIELQPVPMSKNAGNRFVAIFWDSQLNEDPSKDTLDLHEERIALTEEHVMFCRKANMYNETFNQDSMVDVLWSLPMYAEQTKIWFCNLFDLGGLTHPVVLYFLIFRFSLSLSCAPACRRI